MNQSEAGKLIKQNLLDAGFRKVMIFHKRGHVGVVKDFVDIVAIGRASVHFIEGKFTRGEKMSQGQIDTADALTRVGGNVFYWVVNNDNLGEIIDHIIIEDTKPSKERT